MLMDDGHVTLVRHNGTESLCRAYDIIPKLMKDVGCGLGYVEELWW